MGNQKQNKNQFFFGIFLGLLFSIIGLFAGHLYPPESQDRLTLIEGWKYGIFIQFMSIVCYFVIKFLIIK